MNRVIKFRAWNGFRHEMNKVLNVGWYEGIYMNISLDTEEGQVDYNDTIDNMECENIDLMQYTGLKDKNGKEIYEGDIVKLGTYTKGVVEYSDKYAQFVITNTNTIEYECEPLGDYTKIEVIGNKYDNLELLEAGD